MMKRVARQFKLIMQPYYRSGKITKDEYKDVMRKAVPAVRYFLFLFVQKSYLDLSSTVKLLVSVI